jgi:hypothetical protein
VAVGHGATFELALMCVSHFVKTVQTKMAWRGQRQAREESELEERKTEDKRGGGVRNENG